jgi:hypothetical protein
MPDGSQEATRQDFLRRLTKEIDSHKRLRRWDSGLHQSLVIGSAVAGFASLTFGLLAHQYNNENYGVWAGAIGALTSVATILSQQFQCVKAINLHSRMAVQLDVIRAKFLDKYRSAPTDQQLAELSEEVSNLRLAMLDVWEKATGDEPNLLGKPRNPPKGIHRESESSMSPG